ncbi:MAG: hypothetical protein E7265_05630 [Lachnospiraceae bacterium]|nr:hypothetical protein [Lachnospiraceae bacterium]
MAGKDKIRFQMGTGIVSILMIFVVLILTTFGVLSFATARSDLEMAEKSLDSVISLYKAEAVVERCLYDIDKSIESERNEECILTENVMKNVKAKADEYEIKPVFSIDENIFKFLVKIDDTRAYEVWVNINDKEAEKYSDIIKYAVVNTTEWTGSDELFDEIIFG